jgi:hypothetical protein
MKTKTSPITDSMNRSPMRLAFLQIPLVLASFALSPAAQAACQRGCLTNENTVLGDDALFSLTTGIENTATGFQALYSNTTGGDNTANGVSALYSNIDGGSNTAIGARALYSNTNGVANTGIGAYALYTNTTAVGNTATGYAALFSNTTGNGNTAYGEYALTTNTEGFINTAIGDSALVGNVSGSRNTAVGWDTLVANSTGSNNTALGSGALSFNFSGNNNIAIGYNAGTGISGSDNIDVGNAGVNMDVGTIRIGTRGTQRNTFIAGISGVTVPGGVGVIVGTNGKLGTVVSSERLKQNIKPMDKASEAILALQPVTFRYKHELDPNGIPQFGLVAEDVEKVNPDLVARDDQGKVYTVRYEAVNAMLLNEFLKEHRKVEDLKNDFQATVAQQQKEIKALTAQLKEQAAQIQKVSAQLEVNKTASQIVLNNQ